jgi:hypothetical protein
MLLKQPAQKNTIFSAAHRFTCDYCEGADIVKHLSMARRNGKIAYQFKCTVDTDVWRWRGIQFTAYIGMFLRTRLA